MSETKVIRSFEPKEIEAWPLMPGRHEQILNWFRANGINPEDVPCVFPIFIERVGNAVSGTAQIRFYRFIRDEAGYVQLRYDADEVLAEEVEEVTVPLLIAWTEPR